MTQYDIIIIGAGPGGMEACSIALAQGLNTAVIESREVGGTCLNRGCIPTKALCRSAEVAETLREATRYGIDVTTDTSHLRDSYPKAAQRKDEIVAQLREGAQMQMAKATLIQGHAKITPDRCVEVNGEKLHAPRIVIATGSQPARLDIPGAELAMTSDQLLEADTLPQTMVIIGGGVIGMEFACILHTFGVEVTVVEYCPEILPGFDKDVAKRLHSILSRKGIKIVTSAKVEAITKTGHGVEVAYEAKGKPMTIEADIALMATGRRPVIPEGAEEAGVKVGRKGIEVDLHFATHAPGIYAIGDVNGHTMLAHVASAQAAVMMGLERHLDTIPAVAFTAPECAMCGLTEQQCKEAGLDVATTKRLYRSNGKAMAMGESDGFVKTITDKATGRIVGCHIIGAHASDLIAEAAVAISNRLTPDQLSLTIHAHPTLSELLL